MNNLQLELDLATEQDTLNIAAQVAQALQVPAVIYLHGELGAGKTCFSRGVIRALGFEGRVKSPTFTLVEPYTLSSQQQIFHFDFYRLSDPDEALYLGLDNYWEQAFLCLIEWPDLARGYIPSADLNVQLFYQGLSRRILLQAATQKGNALIEQVTSIL